MNADETLTFGVAVTVLNSVDNMRRCLLSVAAASPSLTNHIVVVDDSGSGLVWQALHREFSHVHWVVHEKNMGFGATATEAVASCLADVVILLNDDVELRVDPLPHLRQTFAAHNVFAATFKSLHPDGTFREGAKRLVWPLGFPRILHHEKDQRVTKSGVRFSAYAVGGHAAYHRRRFLELHGFDTLFEPFYWEDVDVCRRAQQRGWLTVYLPDCTVTHGSTGAIRSTHQETQIRDITLRNRLLFAWRHCPRALRPWLSLSIAAQITAARLTGNTIFTRARQAARERLKTYSALSPQNPVR